MLHGQNKSMGIGFQPDRLMSLLNPSCSCSILVMLLGFLLDTVFVCLLRFRIRIWSYTAFHRAFLFAGLVWYHMAGLHTACAGQLPAAGAHGGTHTIDGAL